jgi:hypothetical protein
MLGTFVRAFTYGHVRQLEWFAPRLHIQDGPGSGATRAPEADRLTVLVVEPADYRTVALAERRWVRRADLQSGSCGGGAGDYACAVAPLSLTDGPWESLLPETYPCSRSSAAGDFATGPRATRCASAPSCSNKAAPRSSKSSWTSFAARTLAPNPQRDHRAFASA